MSGLQARLRAKCLHFPGNAEVFPGNAGNVLGNQSKIIIQLYNFYFESCNELRVCSKFQSMTS